MTEASLLSVVVRASTGAATAQLASVERQFLSTAKTAKGMDAATATAGRSAGAASSMMRSAASGGALALAAGLYTSTKKAVDFDRAMRNVNSIARLSEPQFKSVSKSVRDMAPDVVQSPTKLAEGMYDLVSSGFSANDSLTVLRASAKAASAGLTTAEVATKAVAGALNSYKLSAKDAEQVSDILFTTVDKGVLTFEDLAQGIGPVLPFANKLGVDLRQVGAMTAHLTKEGIPAAESFTYLKGAMAQMVKPTGDLKSAYKELGVTSGRDLVEKTGSLQDALEALYQSVDGDSQKFAKLFPDIRGMTAAFVATGKGAGEAERMLGEFNRTAGKTNKVFEEQSKSTGMQFDKAKVSVEKLATEYGEGLAPGLRTVATLLTAAANAASEIPGPAKKALGLFQQFTVSPIGALVNNLGDLEDKINRIPVIKDLIPGGAETRADRIAQRLLRLEDLAKRVNATRLWMGKSPISPQQQAAVDSLVGSMRRLQVSKATQFKILTTGTPEALAKMGALANLVKGTKKEAKFKAIIEGDGSVESKLKRIRTLIDDIPKKRKTEINAADKATNVLTAIDKAVRNVPGYRNIRVLADTSGALSGLAAVRSAIAGIPSNVSTAVNVTVNKHKGRAGGGRVTESMTLVGERGPELVSLPYGSYVYTASQSKQMMADAAGAGVDQMAGGGKKKKAAERKRKRLDRIERRAQAKLDTVDYLDHLGKLTDPQEIARLRKIGKTKGLRKRVKRDINTRIFDVQGEQTDRASRIADLMDQQRGVGKSDAEKAQIALETANRHLAEAGDDPLAVAEAQLEIAEANNALVEAQNQAMKALQQSIDENTKAIADHTKEIQKVSASNSFQFARAFQDIIDRQLAGNWGGVIAVQAQRPVTT